MEPTTAIGIAKFAYSTYEFLYAEEDTSQFDAIMKFLNQINTKLDIIIDKLDLIYIEIEQLPDKIEYNKNISTLNGIIEELKPFYNTLNDFRDEFGNKKGTRKFLNANNNIERIEKYLYDFRETFQKLEKYKDPITTCYLATCAKFDYQLSLLISTDDITLKNRLKDYLTYFNDSTLEAQIIVVRTDIENWRKLESMLNRAEYFKKPLPGITWILDGGLIFLELKPLPLVLAELPIEEQNIINSLLVKNFLKTEDLNIKFNYIGRNIGPVGGYVNAHLQRKPIIKLIEAGYLKPGAKGLQSQGFSIKPGDKTFNKVYKKKYISLDFEYKLLLNKLISYLSALNTNNEIKTYLTNLINEYEE